jgi:hypothetical protein
MHGFGSLNLWQGASGGGAGLTRTSPLSDIESSIVFDIDTTILGSYDPSSDAQLMKNLVVSPADGETQTAYDWRFGSTSGSDTADPTFNGTAGTTSGYLTFPGGGYDYLELANGNTALINALHKTTGGQDFTLIACFKMPDPLSSGNASYFGNGSGRGIAAQIECRSGSNQEIFLFQEGDSGKVSINRRPSGLVAGEDAIVVTTYDRATNTAKFACNSTTYDTASQVAFIASTLDPQIVDAKSLGANSDYRLRHLSVYNKQLTEAEFNAIITQLNLRHGITYV